MKSNSRTKTILAPLLFVLGLLTEVNLVAHGTHLGPGVEFVRFHCVGSSMHFIDHPGPNAQSWEFHLFPGVCLDHSNNPQP